jgi:acyl dehydratase
MLILENPKELARYLGQEIGLSDWFTINQAQINEFAKATGDEQWIHVDTERCRRESPTGKTMAHGFMLLSMYPQLLFGLLDIRNVRMALNYGLNKVRFTSPIWVDSWLRLRVQLTDFQEDKSGIKVTFALIFEKQDQEKPVCVAEALSMFQ